MSGVASGITKVFTSVGNAATKVGQAVMGVGATTFTAGAAAGAAPMASGGISSIAQGLTGGGVLGNILTGAVKQAGFGALVGGGIGALTGQGFGKGALMGGLTGAVTGGLSGAVAAPSPGIDGIVTGATPTGAVPTGRTAASGPSPLTDSQFNDRVSGFPSMAGSIGGSTPADAGAAPAAAPTQGGGLMSFLTSETGGRIIGGLGQGLAAGLEAKAVADEYDARRQFERDKEQRLQDSYNVDPTALPNGQSSGVVQDQPRPTPAQKYGRSRYEYDPAQGRIVMVPA